MDESERDRHLDEILAAYLEAQAAGWAPDRRQLLHCYPHLADDLIRYFAGEDAVENITAPLFGDAPPAPRSSTHEHPGTPPEALSPDKTLPQVPDYDILAEIGRGGWAVVYRARHRTLDRTVALKILLAGSHASAADLERFRSE